MKATYIGNGEGYHGIPARDLSAEDWAGLTKAQQKLVAGSPLYKLVEQEKPSRQDDKKAKEKS